VGSGQETSSVEHEKRISEVNRMEKRTYFFISQSVITVFFPVYQSKNKIYK
jgi:hypothetical protein